MLLERFWVSFVYKENFTYSEKIRKSHIRKDCKRINQIIELVKKI